MRHSGRPEGEREWSELDVTTAIFLLVVSAKEEAEERQLVGMCRQLVGTGVMQVGKDRAAYRSFVKHTAVEFAARQSLLDDCLSHRCCQLPVLTEC